MNPQLLAILIQEGGPILVKLLQTLEPILLQQLQGHVQTALDTHPANVVPKP